MQNEMKIRSQLDETKLKLDSSSLYYEVDPTGTGPALAPTVRICSPGVKSQHEYICNGVPGMVPGRSCRSVYCI